MLNGISQILIPSFVKMKLFLLRFTECHTLLLVITLIFLSQVYLLTYSPTNMNKRRGWAPQCSTTNEPTFITVFFIPLIITRQT